VLIFPACSEEGGGIPAGSERSGRGPRTPTPLLLLPTLPPHSTQSPNVRPISATCRACRHKAGDQKSCGYVQANVCLQTLLESGGWFPTLVEVSGCFQTLVEDSVHMFLNLTWGEWLMVGSRPWSMSADGIRPWSRSLEDFKSRQRSLDGFCCRSFSSLWLRSMDDSRLWSNGFNPCLRSGGGWFQTSLWSDVLVLRIVYPS
jgi:hypothetical protein